MAEELTNARKGFGYIAPHFARLTDKASQRVHASPNAGRGNAIGRIRHASDDPA
jgi:hypothetical protein